MRIKSLTIFAFFFSLLFALVFPKSASAANYQATATVNEPQIIVTITNATVS